MQTRQKKRCVASSPDAASKKHKSGHQQQQQQQQQKQQRGSSSKASAATSTTFAWRDDDRSFVVYPPSVVQAIADAVTAGKKSVDIAVNPARPRQMTHRIQIKEGNSQFIQLSIATNFSRPVHRISITDDNDDDSEDEQKYVLEWQAEQSFCNWTSYSVKVGALLNKTVGKGMLNCHTNIGKHAYTIDVRGMQQVNDATGTSRRIRCAVKDYPNTVDLASSDDEDEDEDSDEVEVVDDDDDDEEEEEEEEEEVVAVAGNSTASSTSLSTSTAASTSAQASAPSTDPATLAVQRLTKWKVITDMSQLDADDIACAVCLMDFEDDELHSAGEVVRLSKCKIHCFHAPCIVQAFNHRKVCPTCTQRYSVDMGTQPTNGQMSVSRSSKPKLSGHPKSKGTIAVQYHFSDGVQGEEHPYPGKQYSGTSRHAYLPDSPEGNKVLKLLEKAFKNRLVFTVGRSVTTGQDSCVVWNGVHHKTSTTGGSTNFGYPDNTYLQRVTQELASKGIVEEEEDE